MEGCNKYDLLNLMCFENISTCLGNSKSGVEDESIVSWNHKYLNNQCLSYENMRLELFLSLFILSDDIVLCLVKKESEHLPRDDYLERLRGGDNSFAELNLIDTRMEAIKWIWKAAAFYGFGLCILSLAVNYMDRFLSVYNFERGHDWSVRLLALACFSIASKLEESYKLPKFEDFEFGESMFETKGIQKMELLVLDHLNWKMQSSTPCSFVDYFLSKISSEQQFPSESSMLNSVDLLSDITKCIDFLEFRPFEIAAATAIFVSKELATNEIDDVLTRFAVVEKDNTLKCIELMKNLAWMEVSSDSSGFNIEPFIPESPNGVVDSAWLSSKSDETTTNELSDANSSPENSNSERQVLP